MPYKSNARNRHTAILMMAVSVGIAGCATPYNSGIEQKGPDSYFLSIRTPSSKGGSAEAKRQAVKQANEHCAKSGKVAQVTNEELGPVTADIYFACIAK